MQGRALPTHCGTGLPSADESKNCSDATLRSTCHQNIDDVMRSVRYPYSTHEYHVSTKEYLPCSEKIV